MSFTMIKEMNSINEIMHMHNLELNFKTKISVIIDTDSSTLNVTTDVYFVILLCCTGAPSLPKTVLKANF